MQQNTITSKNIIFVYGIHLNIFFNRRQLHFKEKEDNLNIFETGRQCKKNLAKLGDGRG